ncbi:GntR family transcriptional regulator [Streptomyces spinosirectus]
MSLQNDRITIPAARPGQTALYRFIDDSDRLLYVGITSNPAKRWADHRRYAATTWWPLAGRADVDWFDSRKDAAAAELRMIRTQAPLYNSGGAPSPLRELAPGENLCPRTALSKLADEIGMDRWRRMHIHEAVADVLQSDIKAGRLPAGSALPTATELVGRFGVSVATVRRAVGHVVDSGHVVRRGEGSGTRYFVAG